MTHGQSSCTKILVRVSCTRNLDRLPSALNTVHSSRVSKVSAMVSVRFSGMFNMVQEFGTTVYKIAGFSSNIIFDYLMPVRGLLLVYRQCVAGADVSGQFN